MERVVRLGGFLAVVIPFVWGLDNFFERPSRRVLRWVVLALLLLGSAAAAWYLTFRRSDDE